MSMNERQVQKVLFNGYIGKRYQIAIPNVYLWQWESDFLGVTPYGYIHEFEIKLSKRDFLADFNKEDKHNLLRNYHRDPGRDKVSLPKRFYYAINGFYLDAGELPFYAGLIVVKNNSLKTIRRAPDLEISRKLSIRQLEKLATSLCYRYWNSI